MGKHSKTLKRHHKRSKLSIKSINSDVSVPVVFINKTGKEVEMFWYSFEGELTSYGKIASDGEMEMETFVTHPWSAANAETGEAMLANGQFVFNPCESHDRVHVDITRRDSESSSSSSSSSSESD